MALVGSGDRRTPGWRRPTTLRRPCAWACCWRCGGRSDPEVARFLDDADPQLVVEAARAINDVPIEAAMPQLAALASGRGCPSRCGYPRAQRQLPPGRQGERRGRGGLRGRADASEALRIEALHELADWAKPTGRDRVMGVWRPLEARPAERRRRRLPRPCWAASSAAPTRCARRPSSGGEARHQGGRPRAARDGRRREAAGAGARRGAAGAGGAEGCAPGRRR